MKWITRERVKVDRVACPWLIKNFIDPFAAFLGLAPRQSGTGGRVKLLGISKRGDVYLRTLLIHGARSVITHAKERAAWLEKLLSRRPLNVAVVALANKMARTIWALLAHDRTYQKGYVARAA
jgi:transposase